MYPLHAPHTHNFFLSFRPVSVRCQPQAFQPKSCTRNPFLYTPSTCTSISAIVYEFGKALIRHSEVNLCHIRLRFLLFVIQYCRFGPHAFSEMPTGQPNCRVLCLAEVHTQSNTSLKTVSSSKTNDIHTKFPSAVNAPSLWLISSLVFLSFL